MRELEFRGKSVETNEWVYGDFRRKQVEYDDDMWHEECIIYRADHNYMTGVKVYKESVGQYISLRDKKGMKIYEKDIVKAKEGRLCMVVWFTSPMTAQWDLKILETRNPPPMDPIWSGIETIGNALDDPELLEETRKP